MLQRSAKDLITRGATSVKRERYVAGAIIGFDRRGLTANVAQIGLCGALLEELSGFGLEINTDKPQRRKEVRKRQYKIATPAPKVDNDGAGLWVCSRQQRSKVFNLCSLPLAAHVDGHFHGRVRCCVDAIADPHVCSSKRCAVWVAGLGQRAPVDLDTPFWRKHGVRI